MYRLPELIKKSRKRKANLKGWLSCELVALSVANHAVMLGQVIECAYGKNCLNHLTGPRQGA